MPVVYRLLDKLQKIGLIERSKDNDERGKEMSNMKMVRETMKKMTMTTGIVAMLQSGLILEKEGYAMMREDENSMNQKVRSTMEKDIEDWIDFFNNKSIYSDDDFLTFSNSSAGRLFINTHPEQLVSSFVEETLKRINLGVYKCDKGRVNSCTRTLTNIKNNVNRIDKSTDSVKGLFKEIISRIIFSLYY